MRRWVPLAGMTSVLISNVAFASYDLERVMTELANREKTISAIRFDFKQEINFLQMNSKTTVVGEALFGKQGKLRITKQSPDNQVTVSDGKKVWVYNPAAKQVWEGSSKKWLESPVMPKGMVPLNDYVGELRKNFDLALDGSGVESESEIRILAQPKNKDLAYKIEITVSTASWLPVKTVYRSDSASVLTLLSKHQVNPSAPDSIFRFSAPKGTDVIPFN